MIEFAGSLSRTTRRLSQRTRASEHRSDRPSYRRNRNRSKTQCAHI